MPITRKQYVSNNFKSRSFGDENYVLAFLKKNKDKAYRPQEIAKALNKGQSTIAQNLRKLIKQGVVERTIPYYIFSEKKTSVKKTVKKKKR